MKKPFLILLTAVCFGVIIVGAEQPPADKAQQAALKFLADAKVTDVGPDMLQPMADAVLAVVFPTRRFYLLRFPQYPVARVPTAPLQTNNILAVSTDLKVTVLSTHEALLEFFKTETAAVAPIRIATAWATLDKELLDDGFFHFNLRPDQAKGNPNDHGMEITLPVQLRPGGGNHGGLVYHLTFDANRRLIAQSVDNDLSKGPRPTPSAAP
jgi:hypothetical protein